MHNKDEAVSTRITDAFRAWLSDSLKILGVSSRRLGCDLGLGVNTLGHFLRDPSRDIKLETAHRAATALRLQASARGLELPKMEARFHG